MVCRRADCTLALLECGADVKATTRTGWTPVHFAAHSIYTRER